MYNRTQCKSCSDCFAQSTPIFDPSLSSSYKKLPCSHALCSTQALLEFSCKLNDCEHTYTYGDFSITDISVGKTLLSIPNGTFDIQSDGIGGFIIDSGTTITYLPSPAYGALKKEMGSLIKLTRADGFQDGLDLCYKFSVLNTSLTTFPSVTFHFKGADYALPPKNYMVSADNRGKLLCLAMLPSDDGVSIFGNAATELPNSLRSEKKISLLLACAL